MGCLGFRVRRDSAWWRSRTETERNPRPSFAPLPLATMATAPPTTALPPTPPAPSVSAATVTLPAGANSAPSAPRSLAPEIGPEPTRSGFDSQTSRPGSRRASAPPRSQTSALIDLNGPRPDSGACLSVPVERLEEPPRRMRSARPPRLSVPPSHPRASPTNHTNHAASYSVAHWWRMRS